jgi:hypothetical protein
MLFIGLAVIFVNDGKAWDECGVDNATCATGHQSHVWLGRVYDSAGAPAARATVLFDFPSSQTVRVATDRTGRYCLRWGTESETPVLAAIARASSGPADPLYVSLARRTRGAVIVVPRNAQLGRGTEWAPRAGFVTSVGWNAPLDATRQCVSSAPPWYRFSDLSSNWRSRLLIWGPIVAILLAVIGGIMWLANRRPGFSVVIGSLVLMAGCAALCYLTWFTLPPPV